MITNREGSVMEIAQTLAPHKLGFVWTLPLPCTGVVSFGKLWNSDPDPSDPRPQIFRNLWNSWTYGRQRRDFSLPSMHFLETTSCSHHLLRDLVKRAEMKAKVKRMEVSSLWEQRAGLQFFPINLSSARAIKVPVTSLSPGSPFCCPLSSCAPTA